MSTQTMPALAYYNDTWLTCILTITNDTTLQVGSILQLTSGACLIVISQPDPRTLIVREQILRYNTHTGDYYYG